MDPQGEQPLKKLSGTKKLVYEFIQSFVSKNNYSPSVQEIAEGCYLSSRSSVHRHMTDLRDLGYIDWTPNEARTIVVKAKEEQISILIYLKGKAEPIPMTITNFATIDREIRNKINIVRIEVL